MRRLFKPLWVLLAVIFLIEAWLWDHLEPVVERVVARIPLRAFKHWLAEKIAAAEGGEMVPLRAGNRQHDAHRAAADQEHLVAAIAPRENLFSCFV